MGFSEIHRREMQTPEVLADAMSQWEDICKFWVAELETAYPLAEERELFGGDDFEPHLERLSYSDVNGTATLNDSIVRLDDLYLSYSWSLSTGHHSWKLYYLGWSAEGSPRLYTYIVSRGDEKYGIDGKQFRDRLGLFFRQNGLTSTPPGVIRRELRLGPDTSTSVWQ